MSPAIHKRPLEQLGEGDRLGGVAARDARFPHQASHWASIPGLILVSGISMPRGALHWASASRQQRVRLERHFSCSSHVCAGVFIRQNT